MTQAPAPPSFNDRAKGGGFKYRSLSFVAPRPPVKYENLEVLAEPVTRQSRNDKGEPVWWGEGNDKGNKVTYETQSPVWEYWLKLRLPAGFTPDPRIVEEYGEDDGMRLYVFAGSVKEGSRSSYDALMTAVRKAKARDGIQPGGRLSIAWVDGGENRGTTTDKKLWAARYELPPEGYVAEAPSANHAFAEASAGNSAAASDPFTDVPPPTEAPAGDNPWGDEPPW